MSAWTVLEGDCIEQMRGMDECTVDVVVTDPPYNLNFMGRAWDQNMNHGVWAIEALRVLKPGGHLLAFGGTRTYHRLTCAIEDSGFEVRDCLAWLYGSGFPKSLDVSKAIDKAAGAEREVVRMARVGDGNRRGPGFGHEGSTEGIQVTAPATPDAERWQGWGTALKPAFEPIVLARKPLSERNVAANVQRWGTGAINIDATRIEGQAAPFGNGSARSGGMMGKTTHQRGPWESTASGRWPANVILDEQAAQLLDEQSGERPAGVAVRRHGSTATPSPTSWDKPRTPQPDMGYADTGGASRFFYTAKSSRSERERGMRDYHPDKGEDPLLWSSGEQSPGTFQAEGTNRAARNHHPTVKPVALMQWLCRLVTPKGGLVLDPFVGSGSTGIAALREGFRFVGIERDAEYVEIARARIIGDAPLFNSAVGDA